MIAYSNTELCSCNPRIPVDRLTLRFTIAVISAWVESEHEGRRADGLVLLDKWGMIGALNVADAHRPEGLAS